MTLSELLSSYSQVRLATAKDNLALLKFVNGIEMRTKDGGLGIDRTPDFFSLTKAQGAHSYTFLFLNSDLTISGIGCISLTQMLIKGEPQWLGYCSDLKFSKQIESETRRQFYHFYESLIRNFSSIDEFKGCEYVISSILDGNQAAKRALVAKESKKNQLQHRPIYSYENINILARLPLPLFTKPLLVQSGRSVHQDKIIEFLSSNLDDSEMVWSAEEIKRRQQVAGFSFDDFFVHLDERGEIQACGILMSDNQYRKMRVKPMPLSLKLTQMFTGLLGQNTIQESEPIQVGYLSFFKMKSQTTHERAAVIDAFLRMILQSEKLKNKKDRFHIINIQEPAHQGLKVLLQKKGYLLHSFVSTVYQVTSREEEKFYLKKTQSPLDFDVVFH